MDIKQWIKKGIVFLAVVFIAGNIKFPVFAYFSRGDVSVSLGENSVSLEQGESRSVSVKVSPSSSSQLPGCGMAECPRICGEKNCLDKNGECTCAGTDYKTYNADVKVSSSNTSVASVSYGGGTLHIKAVGSGTAKVTVTGSLRQYSDGSSSVSVTVQKKEQGKGEQPQETDHAEAVSKSEPAETKKGTSSKKAKKTKQKKIKQRKKIVSKEKTNNKKEKLSSAESSTESIKTEKITEKKENTIKAEKEEIRKIKKGKKTETKTQKTETATDTTKESPEWTALKSDKGMIYFSEITDGAIGKKLLEKIAGTGNYANFRKMSEGENVLYSWEFFGKDISSAENWNMTIALHEEPSEKISALADGQKILCLDFASQERFPAPADIYIKAGDLFQEGEKLYLYKYDNSQNTAELTGDILTVTDGYVHQIFRKGGNYFLTEKMLNQPQKKQKDVFPFLLAGGFIILAAGVFLFFRKKRRKG